MEVGTVNLDIFLVKLFLSGFEKKGHLGPDLNSEILICSETIGNQQSFTACFMFIDAWIHIYARLYKLVWPTAKPRKSLLKISEHKAGHYGS